MLFRLWGRTQSCGCAQRDSVQTSHVTHGGAHEGAREQLHRVWTGIKGRCNNPNNTAYGNYGGRGITVCLEWLHDYAAFRAWALDSGYERHLDIDRIDNDSSYSPENCRWVTRSENLRNRRSNRVLTAWGESKVMTTWFEDPRCVVKGNTVVSRLRYGWSVEDALSLPVSAARYSHRNKT